MKPSFIALTPLLILSASGCHGAGIALRKAQQGRGLTAADLPDPSTDADTVEVGTYGEDGDALDPGAAQPVGTAPSPDPGLASPPPAPEGGAPTAAEGPAVESAVPPAPVPPAPPVEEPPAAAPPLPTGPVGEILCAMRLQPDLIVCVASSNAVQINAGTDSELMPSDCTVINGLCGQAMLIYIKAGRRVQ